MGGMVKSAGGLLGLSDGPQAPDVASQNDALSQLGHQNSLYDDLGSQTDLYNYAMDPSKNAAHAISAGSGTFGDPRAMTEFGNALATGATTGSKFATEQVQNNPLLAGLYGQNGAMNSMANNLNSQVGQGWQLQPEDQTMYGQAAGNIARQFGQQENQTANDLASRGLSSSGAAGASFSGLAGNKNEMLANAQQQIMQQRFQNTMQQSNALNQMGMGAANAVNQQYGRQLSGAQNQKAGLESQGGLQQGANAGLNGANMAAANFNVANTPTNAFDMGASAAGNFIGAGSGAAGKTAGQKVGASLFSGA